MPIKQISLSNSANFFVYTNNVTNATFDTDLTGWTKSGTTTDTNDSTVKLTGLSSFKQVFANVTGYRWQNVVATVNDKIYLGMWCNIATAGLAANRIQIFANQLNNGPSITQISADQTIVNQWQLVKGVVTSTAGGISLRMGCVNATITGTVYWDDAMAINLTALFGAGNEPSATDCANIFRFIDGTKQPSLSKVLAT